ncbi:MAG: DUF4124 domain-containing protein [Gammaproteobacteria bacterium]|nr:DUF4124 domain-containing protein [Gammaproteobacteria bacterium]
MIAHGYRNTFFALLLASAPAHAEIYKCRQGERVIYQSPPCPAGSQPLVLPEALPAPSAYAVEEARSRAKNDIAEADAIWKREDEAAKARKKARAAASKQETNCARLLDKINQAEAKVEPSKQQKKTLKSDQRNYRKECGAL